MAFTSSQCYQIAIDTLTARYTPHRNITLPDGWSLAGSWNEVVYRNLTHTLRFDLGTDWVGQRGCATLGSLRERVQEIIASAQKAVQEADEDSDALYFES